MSEKLRGQLFAYCYWTTMQLVIGPRDHQRPPPRSRWISDPRITKSLGAQFPAGGRMHSAP